MRAAHSLSSCLCATGAVHKVNTPVRDIWGLAADFMVPEHTEQFWWSSGAKGNFGAEDWTAKPFLIAGSKK